MCNDKEYLCYAVYMVISKSFSKFVIGSLDINTTHYMSRWSVDDIYGCYTQ